MVYTFGRWAFIASLNGLGGCLFAFFYNRNAVDPCASGSCVSSTPTSACTGIATCHLPWLPRPSLCVVQRHFTLSPSNVNNYSAPARPKLPRVTPSHTGGVRPYHLTLPRLPTTTHASPLSFAMDVDACGSIATNPYVPSHRHTRRT